MQCIHHILRVFFTERISRCQVYVLSFFRPTRDIERVDDGKDSCGCTWTQLDGRRGASFVSFNQEGQVVFVREARVFPIETAIATAALWRQKRCVSLKGSEPSSRKTPWRAFSQILRWIRVTDISWFLNELAEFLNESRSVLNVQNVIQGMFSALDRILVQEERCIAINCLVIFLQLFCFAFADHGHGPFSNGFPIFSWELQWAAICGSSCSETQLLVRPGSMNYTSNRTRQSNIIKQPIYMNMISITH